MIAKLRGIIDTLEEDRAIVDVNGVGYLVYASAKTLGRLTRGQETSLWIETVVREDSISLFGFLHPLEKEWFLTLTKVQGVELALAVAAQDKASFARAGGVGPKLAARIVSELKGKTVSLATDDVGVLAAGMAEEEESTTPVLPTEQPPAAEDAVSALVNLGYQRPEAFRAVSLAAGKNPEADVGQLIKLALKEFANREV